MTDNNQIVSFDDELLILVDDQDNILGYKDKLECHQGDGILHRAFSLFIFNSKKQLLLQKRSDQKLLWPLFWSNSCCSHPRKGEPYDVAIHRRLREELGFDTKLTYLFKFKYQARFKQVGSEHELCSVYIGLSDQPVMVNPNEISEWRFITIPELETSMEDNPELYTPWFKQEWQRIRSDHMLQIEALFS